ncbi:hypothetical protein [Fredinandcohnia quinoae]|uniref:Lipoprotein n=1 Tax=Fredinandcohnia quinoae TaxID=2918902 RepID=A0AAW5E304_9BACI|nr:hypothetical protein [Fredinandcohnia sp. SECRCQ15]MCH1625610.1 hypothetical protein [Fredinandcohnia sp. SECRCQ15]
MKVYSLMLFLTFLIIATILGGCTNNTKSTNELLSSLDQNLSAEDQASLNSLLDHVEKFVQLNKELELLLNNMKNDDDLESAIDTMDIANEEALYIYNLIELEPRPNNQTLQRIQSGVQISIERFIEGMKLQLEGMTAGNINKRDQGYRQIEETKKELNEFISIISN